MKVILIVEACYCDYFGVFLVVRFVQIGENLGGKKSKFIEKFYKCLLGLYSEVKKF